ncbi:hypothetical protein BC940DRAFT_61447 [Gongronella butleri]|nr:hypothetical protein BC940DRAFT_61447 [Gongronella butleri]
MAMRMLSASFFFLLVLCKFMGCLWRQGSLSRVGHWGCIDRQRMMFRARREGGAKEQRATLDQWQRDTKALSRGGERTSIPLALRLRQKGQNGRARELFFLGFFFDLFFTVGPHPHPVSLFLSLFSFCLLVKR